jgi:hypothetical protein
MLADRLKAMTSLVLHVPSDIERISVIIEKKVASEADALKREAAALEKAITPEAEAELQKLETLLSHIPGLSALVKAHDTVEGVAQKIESFAETALHAVEDALAPAAPSAAAAPSASTPAAPSIL